MTNRDIRIVALFGARVVFGQERANIETLAALQSKGCNVLCVVRPEDWPELIEIRKILDSRGLAWIKAPYVDYPIKGWILHAAKRNPRAFWQGNRILLRVIDEFKATHIHAFNQLYIASFALALVQRNQPLVYRCGDKPILHNLFYRMVWQFVLRRTTQFVADSRYVRRRLVESGAAKERISVIYAPAPIRVRAKDAIIPVVSTMETAFRYVYVGRITRSKGVGVLVEAFKLIISQNKQAHLLLAGPISDWRDDRWARELQSQVGTDPRLSSNIHFLGHVENAPDLIRKCHVHVMPSIEDEAYGLVVIEAKSVGRPSVILRSGGLEELVRGGVDGVIADEKTSASLAIAMKRYLDDPQLLAKHGEAAAKSLDLLKLELFPSLWRGVYDNVF